MWFVNLAAVTDAEHVLPTLAQALSVREEVGRPLAETLVEHLAAKQTLLVVHNSEQVLEAGAGLAGILARAPAVKIIVTSRAPLRVAGEREYAVSPLSEADAVTLFADGRRRRRRRSP